MSLHAATAHDPFISNSLVAHNTVGDIYMPQVGPVHKLIVSRDLKRKLNDKQVFPESLIFPLAPFAWVESVDSGIPRALIS